MRKEQRVEKLRHLLANCEQLLLEVDDCNGQGLLDGMVGVQLYSHAHKLTALAERLLGMSLGVVRGWDYDEVRGIL